MMFMFCCLLLFDDFCCCFVCVSFVCCVHIWCHPMCDQSVFCLRVFCFFFFRSILSSAARPHIVRQKTKNNKNDNTTQLLVLSHAFCVFCLLCFFDLLLCLCSFLCCLNCCFVVFLNACCSADLLFLWCSFFLCF